MPGSDPRFAPPGDGVPAGGGVSAGGAEARLRSVLDSMGEGYVLLSPDFVVLDINAMALQLDSRARDAIIGRLHWDLNPETETSPLGTMLKQAMRDRVAASLQHRHRWADGRVSWLDTRALPTDDGGLALFLRDVTDQEAARRKAQESSARFEGAVRAFADALWTNDADGRMVGEQAGWASLTGQSFDEYQGYGWAQAVHPDDAGPTIAAWQAAVADRRLFVFEHRVRRHDGVWRRFAVRAVPVLGDDGSIREWVGVHSDITELRASEVRFRQLADNIEVVFYINELDEARSSFASPAYERIWQQPVAALYADWSAFRRDIHPDDAGIVVAAAARQDAGENTDIRYRLVLPGVGIRHIHDRAFVTVRADDGGRRVVGIAEDVTVTTEARLRLAANARTFEALVRNTPFGTYVVDSEFRLLQISLGAERVFAGIDPLIGRDFAEVLRIIWAEPFATDAIARFRHTLASGETYVSANTLELRADSNRREAYDWRIDRIELPDGTIGVVCYFYDLSERIALEAQLTEALADKDMLLREIDHRVRNSIAMVASLLSMQSGMSRSAEVKQALGVASARLVAIARIHERLYKGKELGIVAFGTYLEEICRDLNDSLGHDDFTIDLQLAAVDLPVDRAVSLGLVANELVTNAFKHCGDDNCIISVGLAAGDDMLTLTVRDTGVGMPADHDPARRTGLGMRVIDMLVRQLQGSLTAPGAGEPAQFTIRVPMVAKPRTI